MAVYLTLDEALYIHAELIQAFGGADGVRDKGLIESVLLRPQTGYYADLIEEAAALWESLAMNYGFVDGNKRVAYACLELFLGLNGAALDMGNDDIIAFIYHHLENHSFTKPVLEAWLRAHVIEVAL